MAVYLPNFSSFFFSARKANNIRIAFHLSKKNCLNFWSFKKEDMKYNNVVILIFLKDL